MDFDFESQLRKLKRYWRFARGLVLEQIPEKVLAVVRDTLEIALKVASFLIPLLVTVSLTLVVYTVGFEDFYQQHQQTYSAHQYVLLLLSILFTVRFLIRLPRIARWRSRFFNLLLVIAVFYLRSLAHEIPELQEGSTELILRKVTFFAGILLLFLAEVSYVLRFIYKKGVNAALLFVGSFAAFIVIGGFLLMLPNATTNGIRPIDAFFTSASAICVTGMLVVDTATAFTMTGKVIIVMLIQIGGLGIMTFAGLISFMVTGSVSFRNQIALRDMLSSSRMSNVISFISRVVIVTVTFEAIGAFMIYGSLPEEMFKAEGEKIFFSIFHAISGFCNAGMSTLTDGLYDGRVRFNYGLHWVVAILVILGGMGFPVVFNIFTFLRVKISNIVNAFLGQPGKESYTNILQTTSKLALSTYFILMAVGFMSFFIFEYSHSLHEHPTLFGKITTSFFSGTVTPRTSGFNTVNITMLSLPMVMIYLLLMYIGASPGSTGGGIKTTVAAVAFLNMKSIVLGHDRTEAFRSEISSASVKRAFAIILLSLVVLGLSVLLLSIYDSELGLFKLAFEAFCAFSTAGIPLGVTAQLSEFGKVVIMATFFIGRMGALTLLFAVVSKREERPYRYPTENIMF